MIQGRCQVDEGEERQGRAYRGGSRPGLSGDFRSLEEPLDPVPLTTPGLVEGERLLWRAGGGYHRPRAPPLQLGRGSRRHRRTCRRSPPSPRTPSARPRSARDRTGDARSWRGVRTMVEGRRIVGGGQVDLRPDPSAAAAQGGPLFLPGPPRRAGEAGVDGAVRQQVLEPPARSPRGLAELGALRSRPPPTAGTAGTRRFPPDRSGRSRRGQPVRPRYSTASTKSRPDSPGGAPARDLTPAMTAERRPRPRRSASGANRPWRGSPGSMAIDLVENDPHNRFHRREFVNRT